MVPSISQQTERPGTGVAGVESPPRTWLGSGVKRILIGADVGEDGDGVAGSSDRPMGDGGMLLGRRSPSSRSKLH